MINVKKVKIMTELALYEKNNETDFKLSKYYKSDYIRFYMIRTILNVTFAYVICLLLIGLYNIEAIIANAVMMEYSSVMYKVIVGYIVVLVTFVIIAFFVYSNRYMKSKERLVKYYNQLRVLNNMYKAEEKK